VTRKSQPHLNILDLIKCTHPIRYDEKYTITHAYPATGILYITNNSPFFITGKVSMVARDGGRYPHKYEEMINHLFGPEENRIEVCSGTIKGRTWTSGAALSSLNATDSLSSVLNLSSSSSLPFTVDINSRLNPDYVADAQILDGIPNGVFNRWMCDPPYNLSTARNMYGTELPSPIRLLEAGARVCKPGSLMFLLLGKPYQPCPNGVKRIGCIDISVIPNNEVRFLNIYWKYENA
jgi:hypothetical protein